MRGDRAMRVARTEILPSPSRDQIGDDSAPDTAGASTAAPVCACAVVTMDEKKRRLITKPTLRQRYEGDIRGRSIAESHTLQPRSAALLKFDRLAYGVQTPRRDRR